MKLGEGTDYALAALIYLASDGHKTKSLREIAQANSIPEEFLRKIFQILKRHGIIQSFKGKRGGVRLARSADKISVGEVVRIMESKNGLVRCRRGEFCPRHPQCKASSFWDEIEEKLWELLNKKSLKDLLV